jgi:XisI protein
MDGVTDLNAIVEREVEGYSGPALKAVTRALADRERHIYAVVVIPDRPRPFPSRVVVMAHVEGDKVVIDEDTTDRPLWKELVAAGIPREQIILTYAGESLPENA